MAKYRGPVVDVDVHQIWKKPADIIAYLPKRWQSYFAENRHAPMPLKPPANTNYVMLPAGVQRLDARPADGPPGSNYEMMREQLLDRHRHYKTVLTHNVGDQPSLTNPYLAVEVCKAMNQWCLEHWLARDERLHGLIVAPTGIPEEAAKEIRRLGDNPRFVGVLMASNPLGRPFGDPNYHPIYEACVEMGLVVCYHPSSADIGHTKTHLGTPGSSTEYLASGFVPQAMHTVSSLAVSGVFEKYPALRVLMLEFGVSWLPPLLWNLDRNVDILKLESPLLKKSPSEYILEHFMFATQPIEEFPKPDDFIQLLSTVDGIEDRLCFSSDYPHISTDDADYVARMLPSEWHSKVFCQNACRLFNWPLPKTVDSPLAAAAA